mmetsp:Transcript_15435/g.17481  ORF Transcript_15435/g.17481 Transcript_15435/m.17481 type:complete len:325 (-) Transcript_15435:81-1055(-)|eukprot:CAMPEP_0184011160 /NCGR_PEP_ID=MMETSP0954-20121128/3663_1 /TAXON_ID=627963 /ORGANISM="Aplanochytrium sp, Strain PBS07" /LENGTH=324 /DNA_ID=CAMNT_0026290927 /DNA_START=265 /DNA_END=1239 /DNA_ORIENTATION=-
MLALGLVRLKAPAGIAKINRGFSTSIARTAAGKEKNDAAIRKMRSLGSIVERYDRDFVLKLLPENSQPFVTLGWWKERFGEKYWRNMFRKLVLRIKAANAHAQILRMDSSFDREEFPKVAFQKFRELNAGLVSGNRQMLQNSTTDQYFNLLDYKGSAERVLMSQNATSPERVGRIVRLLQTPQVVQTRTCRVSKTDPNLRFAQLSVLYVTEQVLVDSDDPLFEGNKGKVLRRDMTEIKPPGEWKREISPKGMMYYWHTGNRRAQWKKPPGFGISRAHFNPANGTMGNGRVLNYDPETKRVQVANVVVFERPLYNLSVPWKICEF